MMGELHHVHSNVDYMNLHMLSYLYANSHAFVKFCHIYQNISFKPPGLRANFQAN